MNMKQIDPRGLFEDSYLIEGITEGECRSIFLDWAIGIPVGQDPKAWIKIVLHQYQPKNPDHPMTKVLSEGLGAVTKKGRRGGRTGREIDG